MTSTLSPFPKVPPSKATHVKPAKITRVLPESIAEELGFEPGDRIVSINGEKPRDLIDYNFLCADEYLRLEVLDTGDRSHTIDLEKDFDSELGLEFETAVFDGLMQCNNRCPFCFIDQQPPGKRESLYLKDDDYRLSFLYGSYLTLTNLTRSAWDRIEQLRLSPLYVSVHATEPAVREKLLKNDRAGEILNQLQWFRDRRLQIHAQVVLCPGINDGAHLETTLRDLAGFYNADPNRPQSARAVDLGARASGLQSRAWALGEGGEGSVASFHDDGQIDKGQDEGQENNAKYSAKHHAENESYEVEGFDNKLDTEDFEEGVDPGFEGDFEGGAIAYEIDDDQEGGDDEEWDDAELDRAAEGGDDWLPPTVTSVAVVPVGLTRFRPDLDELDPVSPAKAREVIDQVQALQAECRETLGSTFVWLADEWFVIAGQALPPLEAYEKFPQIDNGVGSIRLFVDRFEQAIAQRISTLPPAQGPHTLPTPRRYTWVVGNMVKLAFAPLVDQLNTIDGLTVTLAALNSDYWGQQFTVTGLLTGSDLWKSLQGVDLGDGILLPSLMLKHGDPRFLDDITVEELGDRLGVPITIITDADSLVDNCLGHTVSGKPGNHTQG
ncbi:MAG: DUF512 domain-containing protein [Cyanophyceae cyanobacterium]